MQIVWITEMIIEKEQNLTSILTTQLTTLTVTFISVMTQSFATVLMLACDDSPEATLIK